MENCCYGKKNSAKAKNGIAVNQKGNKSGKATDIYNGPLQN